MDPEQITSRQILLYRLIACRPSAVTKYWLRSTLAEDTVEIEAHKSANADVLAGAFIDGDDGLDSDLDPVPNPHSSEVRGARRPAALTAVQAGVEVQFGQRHHTVERSRQIQILHVRLQIREAVRDDGAPRETVRVAPLADVGAGPGAGASGDVGAEAPGEDQRSECREGVRNIPEPLAAEDGWAESIERLGPRCRPTSSADFPAQGDRRHGFSARVAKELILETNLEVVEAGHGRLPIRTQVSEAAGERDFEIRGQPLFEFGANLCFLCAGCVTTAWTQRMCKIEGNSSSSSTNGSEIHELVGELSLPDDFLGRSRLRLNGDDDETKTRPDDGRAVAHL